MSKTPSNLKETVLFINKLLKGNQFAFRGTTSLVLQGYDMIAEDIDIICTEDTALDCNNLLNEYTVQKVKYKESEKFRSFYGIFIMDKINIEIMGEFQILDMKKKWSKRYDASKDEINTVYLENENIPVTKVDVELEMFAKMGRWYAYHKIKRQYADKNEETQQQKLI